MAVRAMYKGVILAGDERVPVKLYAALESRRVGFHLLAAKDCVRVRQEMVDPRTDEPVPREEIRKGLEVEEGVYAVLDEDDLASLEPPASRDIALSRVVPVQAIDDRWYDRAYWLGPDGDDEAYFALVDALGTDREAVACWVMRKRRYQGALRVRGDHLVLIRLRHAEEVVPASALPSPKGRAPDDKEVKLARQLVEALAGDFDPADFPETYTDRVRELVRAKAEGKVVDLAAARDRKEAGGSVADALEQSLKEAKSG